ncbi:hypothetical protein [Yimella sp. cx-51]|uniref:hypothetical protein n=1 Tax=Yimella sp. cx-51 TaxID=2770551 RepID=UPI00165E1EFD|nr:hypothetical protein [Yimella sp. cx-51]MBC9955518.1 hypothetical protein [Yimella sp. cx-51]QTH37897.1 hypothetical protein J5M86_13810 [Yimella sp. cx-51]
MAVIDRLVIEADKPSHTCVSAVSGGRPLGPTHIVVEPRIAKRHRAVGGKLLVVPAGQHERVRGSGWLLQNAWQDPRCRRMANEWWQAIEDHDPARLVAIADYLLDPARPPFRNDSGRSGVAWSLPRPSLMSRASTRPWEVADELLQAAGRPEDAALVRQVHRRLDALTPIEQQTATSAVSTIAEAYAILAGLSVAARSSVDELGRCPQQDADDAVESALCRLKVSLAEAHKTDVHKLRVLRTYAQRWSPRTDPLTLG